MHATQSSLSNIEGDVTLHHPRVQSMTFEFFLAPTASKEAAGIVERLKPDFENPRQLGFMKDHKGGDAMPTPLMTRTRWPPLDLAGSYPRLPSTFFA